MPRRSMRIGVVAYELAHADGVAAHHLHAPSSPAARRGTGRLRRSRASVTSSILCAHGIGLGFHLLRAVIARVEGKLAQVAQVRDEPGVQRAAQRADVSGALAAERERRALGA